MMLLMLNDLFSSRYTTFTSQFLQFCRLFAWESLQLIGQCTGLATRFSVKNPGLCLGWVQSAVFLVGLFTLTVPLAIQSIKWVPEKVLGQPNKYYEVHVTYDGLEVIVCDRS